MATELELLRGLAGIGREDLEPSPELSVLSSSRRRRSRIRRPFMVGKTSLLDATFQQAPEYRLPHAIATRMTKIMANPNIDPLQKQKMVEAEMQNFRLESQGLDLQETPGFLKRLWGEVKAPFKTIGDWIREQELPEDQRRVTGMQLLGAAGELATYILPAGWFFRAAKAATIGAKMIRGAIFAGSSGASFGAFGAMRRGETDPREITNEAITVGAFGAGLGAVFPLGGAVVGKLATRAKLGKFYANPSHLDDLAKNGGISQKAANKAKVEIAEYFRNPLKLELDLPESTKQELFRQEKPGLLSWLIPARNQVALSGKFGQKLVEKSDEFVARKESFVRDSMQIVRKYGEGLTLEERELVFPLVNAFRRAGEAADVGLKQWAKRADRSGALEFHKKVLFEEGVERLWTARQMVRANMAVDEKAALGVLRKITPEKGAQLHRYIEQLGQRYEMFYNEGVAMGRLPKGKSPWRYQPYIYGRDVVDNLTNMGAKKREEAIAHIIKYNPQMTRGEALRLLEEGLRRSTNHESGFTKPRNLELDMFAIRDPELQLMIYSDDFGRQLAYEKVFGRNGQLGFEMIDKLPQGMKEFAEDFWRIVTDTRVKKDPLTGSTGTATSVMAMTLLSLRTTLLQATQLINQANFFGVRRTLGSIFNLIKNPQAKQMAYSEGAYRTFMQDVFDRARQEAVVIGPTAREAGAASNWARWTMKALRLPQADAFMRTVGAQSSKSYFAEIYTIGQRRGYFLDAEKQAIKQIFGLDPDEVIRWATGRDTQGAIKEVGRVSRINPPPTESMLSQAATRGSDFTNVVYDAQYFPMWTQSPLGVLTFQFSRYAYGMTNFVTNGIIKQAQAGNYAPLLRALALYPVAGYAYEEVLSRVMSKDKQIRQNELSKIADGILTTSMGGLMGEVIRDSVQGRAVFTKLALGGPTTSTLQEAHGAIREWVTDGDWRRLSKFITRRIPVVQPVTLWVNKALSQRKMDPEEISDVMADWIQTQRPEVVRTLHGQTIREAETRLIYRALYAGRDETGTMKKIGDRALQLGYNPEKLFHNALNTVRNRRRNEIEEEAGMVANALMFADTAEELREINRVYPQDVVQLAYEIIADRIKTRAGQVAAERAIKR